MYILCTEWHCAKVWLLWISNFRTKRKRNGEMYLSADFYIVPNSIFAESMCIRRREMISMRITKSSKSMCFDILVQSALQYIYICHLRVYLLRFVFQARMNEFCSSTIFFRIFVAEHVEWEPVLVYLTFFFPFIIQTSEIKQ